MLIKERGYKSQLCFCISVFFSIMYYVAHVAAGKKKGSEHLKAEKTREQFAKQV